MAIGVMAGRVAHEINNPLASIQNAFMLVKDAIPPSHPHHAYVAAIEREIQRIATVTRRLTENYRPERDRAVGVAVSAIVADAVAMASDTSSSLPRFDVDNRVHEVFGGPAGLLRHALHRVFDAVARSGGVEGPVRVAVDTDGAELRVRLGYRSASTAPASGQIQFPHRLIAVMGGTYDLRQLEADGKELTVHVPMIRHQEATA
jgi:signal transduction histidine kinase